MRTSGKRTAQHFNFSQLDVDSKISQLSRECLFPPAAGLNHVVQPRSKPRRRLAAHKIGEQMNCTAGMTRIQFDSTNEPERTRTRISRNFKTWKSVVIGDGERRQPLSNCGVDKLRWSI